MVSTIHQYVPELAAHMEAAPHMQGDGSMTLRQIMALLPRADELRMVLENMLATLQ